MALLSSYETHRHIPDHLLHHIILPRLPFKFLNRLKCISKNIHSLISTDAKFAVDQSRLADASSTGFVYMTPSGIAFYGDLTLIGVPDPSLNFLNPTSHKIKLVTCTNGLLLLCGEFSGKKSLCVCNPAIKEMAFVPYVRAKTLYCEMGLAYDPCNFPDRYIIVDPLPNYHKDGILYQFNVFRSDTDKWTSSIHRVYISAPFVVIKPVCTNGVIYWRCGTILMWYDTERDLAGSQTLPMVDGKLIQGINDVGVYAGEITCCHAWRDGIAVWRLNRGSCNWDRLHGTSWDDIVDAFDFDFCHNMQLCRKKRADIFFDRCFICPVGFDGQFIYIVVRLKYQNSTEDLSERLFGWKIKTERVEEKGMITNKRHCFYRIFMYANSMARVPQNLIGAS